MGREGIALWAGELSRLCCHCATDGMGADRHECREKVRGGRENEGSEEGG